MGYLNNSSITVDAILTKKGRELLARGRDEFKITQFALADDEIDYDLYNSDHPLGTAYYGAAIENMPIVEALPDETQMMKYKLVTLPKGTARIPVVRVAQSTIELNANESTIITRKELLSADKQCTILFIGNETGGRASVTVTIKKVEVATTTGNIFD